MPNFGILSPNSNFATESPSVQTAAVKKTELRSAPHTAGTRTAGHDRPTACRLGGVSPWTGLRAAHLAESLVTGHLDPRLPRHADARTFRIDLSQEVERKINI